MHQFQKRMTFTADALVSSLSSRHQFHKPILIFSSDNELIFLFKISFRHCNLRVKVSELCFWSISEQVWNMLQLPTGEEIQEECLLNESPVEYCETSQHTLSWCKLLQLMYYKILYIYMYMYINKIFLLFTKKPI